jgi:hypothetical protein
MGDGEECLENFDPSGTYYAVITNEYGCSITTENVDFVNAVEEVFGDFNNEVILEYLRSGESGGILSSNYPIEEITIFDLSGRVMTHVQGNASNYSINIPNLESSLYICVAVTPKGVGVVKIFP